MQKKGIRRTRKGCFSCRLRKKKCDELHPVCNNCQRNFLSCTWPEFSNQTLKEYQASQEQMSFQTQLCCSAQDIKLKNSSFPRKLSAEVLNSEPTIVLHYDEDDILLQIFLRSVIDLITPPNSRKSIFDVTKGMLRYSCYRKLAICNAAAFLYNTTGTDYKVVEQKYHEALFVLVETMSHPKFDPLDTMLLHAIPLLMVFESSIGYGSEALSKHFHPAFTILLKGLESDSDDRKRSLSFRLFLDSLLFHFCSNALGYSIEMLTKMPNLFKIDETLKQISNDQNVDIWRLHPILGPSASSILTASKACYLLKVPDSDNFFHNSVEVLGAVQKAVKIPLIRENLYEVLNRLFDLASGIILMKALNPLTPTEHKEIQENVDTFMEIFMELKDTKVVTFLGSWPLFVISVCMINEDHKNFVRQSDVFSMSEKVKKTTMNVLEVVWRERQGIETLKDFKLMSKISFS